MAKNNLKKLKKEIEKGKTKHAALNDAEGVPSVSSKVKPGKKKKSYGPVVSRSTK